MRLIQSTLAGIAFASFAQIASAQANPLSVHVLNLVNGLPSAEMVVTLEKRNGEQWTLLNTGVTNEQGRIAGLFPKDAEMAKGAYRVTFKTEKWFSEHNSKSFFPEIPVIFTVDGSVQHYHIPLLLSQYGYSTYRGN